MVKTVFRWYRILATGIGYVVFGLGTGVFSLLLCLNPGTRNANVRSRRKQRFASGAFRVFLGGLTRVGILREIEYTGRQYLEDAGPCVVLANHPTLLDPLVMLAEVGCADCIVKEKHMPYFRVLAHWLDYIPDRRSTALFEECVEHIKDGRTLLIFPERTRSPEGGLRNFSRVPAQVCLAAECSVVPVLIQTNHHAFGRDQSWYEVPPEPLRLKVTFFEPYRPDTNGRFSRRSRELTDEWEAFYQDRLPVESLE